jgi:hypothetical protein
MAFVHASVPDLAHCSDIVLSRATTAIAAAEAAKKKLI